VKKKSKTFWFEKGISKKESKNGAFYGFTQTRLCSMVCYFLLVVLFINFSKSFPL